MTFCDVSLDRATSFALPGVRQTVTSTLCGGLITFFGGGVRGSLKPKMVMEVHILGPIDGQLESCPRGPSRGPCVKTLEDPEWMRVVAFALPPTN